MISSSFEIPSHRRIKSGRINSLTFSSLSRIYSIDSELSSTSIDFDFFSLNFFTFSAKGLCLVFGFDGIYSFIIDLTSSSEIGSKSSSLDCFFLFFFESFEGFEFFLSFLFNGAAFIYYKSD